VIKATRFTAGRTVPYLGTSRSRAPMRLAPLPVLRVGWMSHSAAGLAFLRHLSSSRQLPGLMRSLLGSCPRIRHQPRHQFSIRSASSPSRQVVHCGPRRMARALPLLRPGRCLRPAIVRASKAYLVLHPGHVDMLLPLVRVRRLSKVFLLLVIRPWGPPASSRRSCLGASPSPGPLAATITVPPAATAWRAARTIAA
jgi:hypothetical protein